MNVDQVILLSQKMLEVALLVGTPVLLITFVVGIVVSIFQAATQINEQTMTFIPKIVGVFVTLLIFAPWILQKATAFLISIFNQLPNIGP